MLTDTKMVIMLGQSPSPDGKWAATLGPQNIGRKKAQDRCKFLNFSDNISHTCARFVVRASHKWFFFFFLFFHTQVPYTRVHLGIPKFWAFKMNYFCL